MTFGIFEKPKELKEKVLLNFGIRGRTERYIISLIDKYEKTQNKLVRWLMFLQIKAVLYWYN